METSAKAQEEKVKVHFNPIEDEEKRLENSLTNSLQTKSENKANND